MTNFFLLEPPADLTDQTAGDYGKDRYNTELRMLKESGEDFSPEDGLAVLKAVCQKGTWATLVSFVYSCNEKTVYYCRECDFEHIHMHRFA